MSRGARNKERDREGLAATMTVFAEPYRPQIEAVLREVGLDRCQLLLVDSVNDWAAAVGIRVQSPFLTGMALIQQPGAVPTIVLRSEITRDMRASVTSALELRGFFDEVPRLDDPLAFLEHLVLHEAAHLLLSNASESDCDRWAFDRLRGRFDQA